MTEQTISAREVLRSTFGFTDFRGEQERIIESLIAGQDAFVLMPTGAGKSLCYQIPAIVRPGLAVVISPLIALMKNQVDALRMVGVKAAFLNSSLSLTQVRSVEKDIVNGHLKILYVAPERLLMPGFLAWLAKVKLALFAVDEAHCVSQWGHDFRPEYAKLEILKREFGHVPLIALTATADALTRVDVLKSLQLAKAQVYITGFDRPNIAYRVVEKNNPKAQLLNFINTEYATESGIVYCLSRKGVEATADWLKSKGVKALAYHAGMPSRERALHQERFMQDDGVVMVATLAFGMGIDKPNIRFVVHMNLPKSLEDYYQETGRAGRDGMAATAFMTYGLEDVMVHSKRSLTTTAEDEQKRIEKRKLEAMLSYSESSICRRQILLNYFGDQYVGPCNNCDICLSPMEKWDASVAAQMALSSIIRTKEIFGVAHLIDVLTGKPTPKIQKFNHQKLTVFAVGKERAASEWRSIFRQLIAMGLVTVDHDGYGSLKLAQSCVPILKGQQSLFLRKIAPRAANIRKKEKAPKPVHSEVIKNDLFSKLKLIRLNIAKELGVPPYVIFHDRSLSEMAQTKPASLSEMANIYGVGENKLAKYGHKFMAAIEDYNRG